jgi:hypothetical protein
MRKKAWYQDQDGSFVRTETMIGIEMAGTWYFWQWPQLLGLMREFARAAANGPLRKAKLGRRDRQLFQPQTLVVLPDRKVEPALTDEMRRHLRNAPLPRQGLL